MKKILYSLLFLFTFTSVYSQVGIDEDFEGTAVPTAGVWALTSGDWLTFDNGVGPVANWVPSTAANANGGVGRAAEVLRGFNSGPIPSTSEDWLVMPRRQMRPNEQLRFFTRQGLNGDSGTLYQIRVSTSLNPLDQSAYTVFRTFTEAELNESPIPFNEYNEKVINMTQTGQLLYIAFVKVHTQTGASLSGDKWLIDDVQLALRCLEPSALGAEQITCSSAKIKWSNPGNASSFNVEWGLYPFDQGTSPNPIIDSPSGLPNTPENELSFLNANTEYAFYVQAECGPGRTSEWFGPYFFKTKQTGALCDCPIPFSNLPYSDQSNTNVYGDNITQLSPGTSGCGITGNYLAGQDVVYQYTALSSGNISISMNPFGVTNTGVFVYAECSNIGQNCLAGVANINGNIRNIPLFSVTAGETYYIVISSTAATFNFEYLLTIQAVTCPPPVAPALPTLSAVPSMTSAVLSWANPAGQTYTTWEHYVQLATEGLGDITGPGTSVTGTPTATVTTLQNGNALVSGTNYQYWVRADCGNGTFSAWAGPFLFTTTQCMPVDQCGYVFTLTDAGADGWEGGRMEVRQGGIVVATLGATMTGANQNVTVQLCDDIPFELFWSVCGTAPAEIGVTVKNSFTQTLFTMANNNAPSCGTIVYNDVAECDFPLCQQIAGLGLVPAPGNILTPSSANVRWTIPTWAPVGSTYDVYVVPAPFTAPSNVTPPVNNPPTSYYFANVPSSPFLITGLLQDTQYKFFVRINCPANGPSDWSAPSPTITTLPLCPKVTNLLVVNQTVDPNTIPLATVEAVLNWTTPATPPSNGWYVLAVPVTVPPTPVPAFSTTTWFPVPSLPYTYTGLLPDTQYNYYVVSDCTTNNSDYSNPAGPKAFTTPVTCPVPTALNVITPVTTSTTINMFWTSPNPTPASGWRVIVKPNSFVGTPADTDTGWHTIAPTSIVGAQVNYTYGLIPGEVLQPNSAYKYWVQAICTGNLGDSNTAGPKTFTTIRTCFAPTSLTATGITARNAKLTWVRGTQNGVVSTETSWYVIAVPASEPVPVYPINPTVVGSTGWINVTTLPTVGSEYTFPGGQFGTGYPDGPLIPDTDYKYYVVADCGENNFINIMVSNPIVTEGQDATFTVSLSSPSAVNTVIEFTTNPVSATTADYTPTTIQVTIPAGQLSATVTVPTLTDAIAETSETFVLDGVVTSGNTISSAPQGIATIYDALDIDSDPYVYVSNVTVQEGQTATFTVGLTAASTEPTVINLTLANGTANAADYTAPLVLPIAVTIPAGELTATVTIPTIYDALVEANETFSLVAAVQSENTSNTAATGICTILDGIQGPAKAFHTLPSCIKPATTTVVANSETPYTVNIWWTNGVGSTATTWQILYVPTGTVLTGTEVPQETYSGPIPTAAAGNQYVVGQAPNAPLTPDTTYDIYVRGDCGTYDGVSLWTGPKTFTTDPTCFPPTALTWVNDNANPATLTWAVNAQQPTTTNWEFSYLPYTGNVNNPLSGTIIPVTGQTYTTPTGAGALAPGFYEFYVRAVCSDSDKSKWSGPVIFSIFADPVICAAVDLNLETGDDEIDVCIEDNCTDLTANFNDLGDTTNYNVLPITYNPPFPLIGNPAGSTQLNIQDDDIWGPVVNLPFNICFFGQNSTQVYVGSNGVLRFGVPETFGCPWAFTETIPDPGFPILNAIYGVYQDTFPNATSANRINYGVVGTAPCRAFVVNFFELPQFSCQTSVGLQTSQIVIYETSNVIEVYVQNRSSCTNWNSGSGVIGIQNATGTTAFFPPGKNTGTWSSQNEAFRFTPAGASIVEFEWQDAAGNPLSNSTTLEVCPTETTVYNASATYTNCGVSPVTVTVPVTVNVNQVSVTDLPDVTACGEYILQPLATGKYFTDTNGGGTELLAGSAITETKTVYIFAESGTTPNCTDQEDFLVTINSLPLEPTSGGDQDECAETPIQTLTASATSAPGTTIVWYTDETNSTVATDITLSTVGTVTYWAEAVDNVTGCKSATRDSITLTLRDIPAAPTTGTPEVECETVPIQTLTADATAPAGATVTWYTSEFGPETTTDPSLSIVGTVTYWAESLYPGANGCKSATRTPVTLTINPLPLVPVAADDKDECISSPIQTLTAEATSASGTTIVWYTDETGSTVATDITLSTVGSVTYWAEAVDDVTGCKSATRDSITLTLRDIPAAPTTGTPEVECETVPIQTLTADATAPAGATVTWYTSEFGLETTTDPSLSIVGTVTYWAESLYPGANGCKSATRTPVTLTINPLPLVPVAADDKDECISSPIQTLTAEATSAPGTTIVWYTDETNSTVATDITLSTVGTVTYWAEAVDNVTGCKSATRDSITLTLRDIPAAPTTGTPEVECETVPIQTLTADATAPVGATVTWYTSEFGTEIASDPSLSTVGTVTYWAESLYPGANGCKSATRTPVTLTINPLPLVPVAADDKDECISSPIQTLTAEATSAPGTTIVWYTDETNSTVATDITLSTVGTVTYWAEAVDNVTGCKSATRDSITLTLRDIPAAPTTGTPEVECETVPIQTLTADATAPVGATVTWYTSEFGTEIASDPSLSTVGTVTYWAESLYPGANGCKSATRTPVTLTINPLPLVPVAADDKDECISSPIQTLTAEATSAPGTTIVWYTDETNSTVATDITLSTVGTVTYWAEAVDNVTGCKSATRDSITLTLRDIPAAPTTGTPEVECETVPIQTLTADATAPVDATVTWWDSASGGIQVTNPTLSAVGSVTYYAESIYIVAGCKSATRTPVTLQITAIPMNPTVTDGGIIKECALPTIQTLTAVVGLEPGTDVKWFSDAAGTIPVTNPTLSSIGTQEYWAQSYNPTTLCESIGLTKVTLIIDDVPDFSLTGGCENGKYTINVNPITDFTTSTPTFEWTDSLGQVVSTSSSFQPTKTDTYYCEVTVNGCSSIEPFYATNIACDIQKGISPKGSGGDGNNDFFNLESLNVTKLSIFNRYGSKVYTKDNYEKEWFGQSDKGDELPDGTYYYVIELLNEPTKTGWIYINREQ